MSAAASTTLELSGVLSGAGALTKIGEGTLTISGENNTYTGAINVSAGTLVATHATALGTGAISVSSGAVLEASNGLTYTGITNVGTLNLGGTLTMGADSLIINTGTINFDAGTIFDLSALTAIENDGVFTYTLGTGVDFTGKGFTYNNIIDSKLGTISDWSFTFNDNGTITYTAVSTNSVDWAGGDGIWATGVGGWNSAGTTTPINFTRLDRVTIGVADTSGGTITLGSDVEPLSITVTGSEDWTIENSLGNEYKIAAGSLLKNGSGTLTISTENSYAGGTIINGGTVIANAENALGVGAVTVGSGAALNLAVTNALGSASSLTLNGGTLNVEAMNSFSNELSIGAGSTINLLNAGFILQGKLAGTGALSIVGTGNAADIFSLENESGANSYSGALTVKDAHLSLMSSAALANAASLTLDGAIVSSLLDQSFTQAVTIAGNSTIRTSLVDTGITISGALSGSGTLTKDGAGTLTISGDHSNFTGNMNVDAGTLALTGAYANDIAIANGATLQVDGVKNTGNISGAGTIKAVGTTASSLFDTDNRFTGSLDIASGATLELTFTGRRSRQDMTGITGSGHLKINYDTNQIGAISNWSTFTGTLEIMNSGTGSTGHFFLTGTSNSDDSRFGLIVNGSSSHGLVLGTDGTTTYINSLSGNGAIRHDSGTRETGGNALDLLMNADNLYTGQYGTNDNRSGKLIVGSAGDAHYTLTMSNAAHSVHANAGLVINNATVKFIEAGKWNSSSGITVNDGGILELANNVNITYSTKITGDGSLLVNTESGATITLTGANDYTGGTTINAGRVVANAENALGTGDVTVNAGNLHLQANTINNITIKGDEALSLADGVTHSEGTITLGADAGITVDSGATGSITNIDSGNYTFTKYGEGTLVLDGLFSGANDSFSGVVHEGTLTLVHDASIDGANASWTVNAGATLEGNVKAFGATDANTSILLNGATLKLIEPGTTYYDDDQSGVLNASISLGTTAGQLNNIDLVGNHVVLNTAIVGGNSDGLLTFTNSSNGRAASIHLTGDNSQLVSNIFIGGRTGAWSSNATTTVYIDSENALGQGLITLQDGRLFSNKEHTVYDNDFAFYKGLNATSANSTNDIRAGASEDGTVTFNGNLYFEFTKTDYFDDVKAYRPEGRFYLETTMVEFGDTASFTFGDDITLATGTRIFDFLQSTVNFTGSDEGFEKFNIMYDRKVLDWDYTVTNIAYHQAAIFLADRYYYGADEYEYFLGVEIVDLDYYWTYGDVNWGMGQSTVKWDIPEEYIYSYKDFLNVTIGDTLHGVDERTREGGTITLTSDVEPADIKVVGTEDWTIDGATNGFKIVGETKITKSGSGTLTLNSENTYEGGTFITEGKVISQHSDALSVGDVIVSENAILEFGGGDQTRTAGHGTISGGGSVIVNTTDTGRITIDMDNTYTGGTTVENGTLVTTKSNALGEGDIEIKSGAVLEFGGDDQTRTDAHGTIFGDGKVVIDTTSDEGVIRFTEANTYTGGTDIKQGTLIITDGSAVGAGDVNIYAGATFDVSGGVTVGNDIYFAADEGDKKATAKAGTGLTAQSASGAEASIKSVEGFEHSFGNNQVSNAWLDNISLSATEAVTVKDSTLVNKSSIKQDSADSVTTIDTVTFNDGTGIQHGTVVVDNLTATGSISSNTSLVFTDLLLDISGYMDDSLWTNGYLLVISDTVDSIDLGALKGTSTGISGAPEVPEGWAYVWSTNSQGLIITLIPEPSTVTLSLLALAGLCARRRRKGV